MKRLCFFLALPFFLHTISSRSNAGPDDIRIKASSASPAGRAADRSSVDDASQSAQESQNQFHTAPPFTAPTAPVPDPSGLRKSRFITFSSVAEGMTAIRVSFVSLHHVDPPYTRGPSIPFTQFEGQSLYIGPPTRFVESRTSGVPFFASTLQCEPYYHEWSTISLLQVTGEAIVPSSIYNIQSLAAGCQGDEDNCGAISEILTVQTARWGDVVDPAGPGSPAYADFADISALVDKFKSDPDALTKSETLLSGENERGMVNPGPDISLTDISLAVDAFTGMPYPYKPGKCNNNTSRGCISDEECVTSSGSPPAQCVLCGDVSGGACCRGDGTCDMMPKSACDGPDDRFIGWGEPCSRCCGPSPGCVPLNDFEWFDAISLWPNLDRRDVCKEADEDLTFNCVAWAIGNTTDWIWDEVDLDHDSLWEYSDFDLFFAQYERSAVVYGASNIAVLHTARPLANNCASSKAGGWIRLRHDRNQLEGGFYGNILATYAY